MLIKFELTTVHLQDVCHLPTNVDTVAHFRLTSSPLQALTSKVVSVNGLSPVSLVMTVVVVDPSTILSMWQQFSLPRKRT